MTEIGSNEDQGRRWGMYIYILPNLMTTGNLFCGFFASIQAIQGRFVWAAYAIVVAAIFDQLDGRLARLTRSTSKFGAEYDSLCDLVSFGMAPAIMMFQWALQPFGRIGWVACFLYVACGALRLARFNVQHGIVEKSYFQGLPIPMAAGIIASAVLFFTELDWNPSENWFLLGLMTLLAFVMVSSFRYRSFKDIDLKERLHFQYLILGVIVFVVVVLKHEVMLFVLFTLYAGLGTAFGFFRLGKNVRKMRPNAYAPAKTDETDLVEEHDVLTPPAAPRIGR